MTEAQAIAVPLPASLSVGDIELQGEVSALIEGGIQLSSIRVTKHKVEGGKLSFVEGTPGQLDVDSPNSNNSSVAVTIAKASGNTLSLAFQDSDSDQVRQLRQALSSDNSPPPPSPAGATGSTPDNKRILDQFCDRSLVRLDQEFQLYMDALVGHLLDLSATSHISAGNMDYYEAMNTVKRDREDISRSFITRVQLFFGELRGTADESNATPAADDSLGLIDLHEFEEDLVVDRMINIGEELHELALESLTIRVASLIDQDPLTIKLPVHVAQISRALQHSVHKLDISFEVMPDLFDTFIAVVIRNLAGFYQDLNSWLSKQGIEPDIEAQITEQGSLLKKALTVKKSREGSRKTTAPEPEHLPAPDSAQAGHQPEGGASATDAHDPGSEGMAAADPGRAIDADTLYQSVIDALNFRREANQLEAGGAGTNESTRGAVDSLLQAGTGKQAGGTGAAENLASTQSVASALGGLQQNAQIRQQLQETTSLRELLTSNRDNIAGLQDIEGLSADSLNQIDLVDNLFGSIKSQLDVTQDLKPALGDLQIPLAKLALLDPQFFLNREHAGRGVLDKLAQLSSSANYPNKALEGRVSNIIDEIVEKYDSDSSVFDHALKDVEKLVDQQERALARNRERVVKTQEGQQKLAEANEAVNQVIRSRIRPPSAPKALVDLIENGWRDLLVLSHIKEGVTGHTWKEHIKTLDLLSLWLIERQKGDVDDSVLVQRGLEAEPFIDMLNQQISEALPTNVAHEPVLETLRNILKGRESIATTRISRTDGGVQPSAAEVRQKIESLPRLRRWVRRVEQLPLGTWLSYRDKEGHKRRMQLAWVSPDMDRFIFVNERGQKVADLTGVKLARQLSKGVRPPAPAENLSLVDKSMYDTLEHVQKSLSFAKNHDNLTRLINRQTFEQQLAKTLKHAQIKRSTHALLYLDIDQFSLVNEIYDRIDGDQVLVEFARLLSQLHGKKSSSARIQGDEFAILLIDCTLNQAMKFAEKVRADIEQSSVEIEGEKIIFTVSIGVNPIVEYSPTVPVILDEARQAVSQAKAKGSNCVVAFKEDQTRKAVYKKQQSEALSNIEQTLETDRFVLQAQPIVQTDIKGERGDTRHYEILLGLSNPDGTLTSPQEFILAAERFGYMTQVDRWVVRETFSWISTLMDAQKQVPHLSINLSGNSITDDAFMEYVLEQISEFGVGTSRLVFEITETGTISNMVKAADFVRAFRNIGCKFSIDDFGTGLASHNYLRELPVDYVKIDGTFVANIHNDKNDYAMARSINDLAHFLGQETIAECVENQAIVDKLREIGVDYLQGWGVGKPKPLPDIALELANIEK